MVMPRRCPLQESEDAVKALAKEKDLLEREKWELRRQAKEATDHATALRSQLDLKDNRMKELEAELAMVSPASTPRAVPAPAGSDIFYKAHFHLKCTYLFRKTCGRKYTQKSNHGFL